MSTGSDDSRNSEQRSADNNYFDHLLKKLSYREHRLLHNELIARDPDENSKYAIISNHNIMNSLKRKLARFNEDKDRINSLINDIKSKQLTEASFDWIKNDIRTQLFVYKYLTDNNFIVNIIDNNCLDKIYDLFYGFQCRGSIKSIDDQARLLSNAQSIRQRVLKNDNYTKWLVKSDNDQVAWVSNYLNNKIPITNICVPSDSDRNQIEYILGILDSYWLYRVNDSSGQITINYDYDAKTIFINKMKRGWSQQKFRNAGKTKKPFHLPLTKATKERLVKMSEVYNVTPADLLEMLINNEYETEFLDNKGKDVY